MRNHSRSLITLLESMGIVGRPILAAEIGVFEGHNSAALLRALPNLHLILCDHWRGVSPDDPCRELLDEMRKRLQDDHDRAYAKTLAATEFAADRRRIIRADSVAGAALVDDSSLDLVFLDAAKHTYDDTANDTAAWLPKVRSGGWLAWHDYTGRRYPNVAKVAHETADRLGVQVQVMSGRLAAVCVL